MRLTPRKIKNLTIKALKNKPEWKPPPGYKYLKDLEPGSLFQVGTTGGILIECDINARVIITETVEDDKTLLGKKLISAQTEVKEL